MFEGLISPEKCYGMLGTVYLYYTKDVYPFHRSCVLQDQTDMQAQRSWCLLAYVSARGTVCVTRMI